MPWPSEKSPTTRLKKVRRSRKWLMVSLRWRCRRGEWRARCRRAALDVVEQAAATRVESPGDDHAAHIEGEEAPQGGFDAARKGDRRAVGLGDEEGAERGDRRRESGDRGGLLFGLAQTRCGVDIAHQARDLLAHD